MASDKIDFEKIYKSLIPKIQEENKGITHQQFAAGVRNGTMGMKVMTGEPSDLLTGSRKVMFNLLVILYTWVPIIIIPVFAYMAGNWWLLLGIIFSYFFTRLAAWGGAKHPGKWKANIIIYYALFCLGYWIFNGFHFYDYITFFFFCSLWGHMLFLMAENSQNTYALQILASDRGLFEKVIAESRIMIISRDKENNRMAEEINQEKASKLLEIANEKLGTGDYTGAINEYSKSIDFYPFITAFEGRGNGKLKLQDYNGAISDYSEAINRMPPYADKKKFAKIYRSRGEVKLLLKLNSEAQLDFIAADKLLP